MAIKYSGNYVGNKIFEFTNEDEEISGGIGNDRIDGLGGRDILYGNGGDDDLYVGHESSTVRLFFADDIAYGGIGNDRLLGIHPETTDAAGNPILWRDDIGKISNIISGVTSPITADFLYGEAGQDVYYLGRTDKAIDIIGSKDNDVVFRIRIKLDSTPYTGDVVNTSDASGKYRATFIADFRDPKQQSRFSLAQSSFNYKAIPNAQGNIQLFVGNASDGIIATPKVNYKNDPAIPDADEQFLDIWYNDSVYRDASFTGERTPDIDIPGINYSPILQRLESYPTADGSFDTTTVLRFTEGIVLVDKLGNPFFLQNQATTPLTDGDFGITYPGIIGFEANKNDYLIGGNQNKGYDQWQRDVIASLKKGGISEGEKKTWSNIQDYLENSLFPSVVGYRQGLVYGTSAQNKNLKFYIENLDGTNREISFPSPILVASNTNSFNPTPNLI